MKILIVDDEERFADRLAERLKMRGFDPVTVYDGASALSVLNTQRFERMILDLRLPDIDGVEVLQQTAANFPGLHIVVLSGHASARDFSVCLANGAKACLQKPARMQHLLDALAEQTVSEDA